MYRLATDPCYSWVHSPQSKGKTKHHSFAAVIMISYFRWRLHPQLQQRFLETPHPTLISMLSSSRYL